MASLVAALMSLSLAAATVLMPVATSVLYVWCGASRRVRILGILAPSPTPAAARGRSISPESQHRGGTDRLPYRRPRFPGAEIRILLQGIGDHEIAKNRMHLDLDTVEAEVWRLEALGAVRWDH